MFFLKLLYMLTYLQIKESNTICRFIFSLNLPKKIKKNFELNISMNIILQ